MSRHFCLRVCVAALLSYPIARAQPVLRVYSEFSRIDPFGKVAARDRGSRGPREILSPLLARNAWASFHIAVTAAPGTSYELHVGQNPEDAVRVTGFQEIFEKQDDQWLPDRVQQVSLPFEGRIPQDGAIPGQTTQGFLMDIWVDGGAPVRRIKVEPQLWVEGRWIIYPMEVRIGEVRVPRVFPTPAVLPPVTAPADAAAKAALCGQAERSEAQNGSTVRYAIRRNALQDAGLLKSAGDVVRKQVAALTAGCADDVPRSEFGAEWYLRVRDALFRTGVQP